MIGTKVGMTQVFEKDGKIKAVTIVSVGPCQVLGIRDYSTKKALVLGYEERTKSLIKPVVGIYQKLSETAGKTITPKRHVKEFVVNEIVHAVGDVINADHFKEGDVISVTSTSKGKGTAGVMKRHGMHGGPATHGSHFHRGPGSIGANTFPARVWKGQPMAGRMGNEKATVKGLAIHKVDSENNLLYILGAIPGAKRGIVFIKK